MQTFFFRKETKFPLQFAYAIIRLTYIALLINNLVSKLGGNFFVCGKTIQTQHDL